ncbi:MAG: hypothetical protein R3247_06970 [Rhodothermales bacterium]|nr:hypothetical protein [Rhodothermales bacterium]
MDLTPTQIDLRIDELVLDGLDGVNASHVGAVVQRELARLLTAHGVPPAWRQDGGAPRVDAGSITLAPGAPADAVGAQVARAVYGSMTGGNAAGGSSDGGTSR